MQDLTITLNSGFTQQFGLTAGSPLGFEVTGTCQPGSRGALTVTLSREDARHFGNLLITVRSRVGGKYRAQIARQIKHIDTLLRA